MAACAAIGYAAYALAGYSWDAVVTYRSPYAPIEGADQDPGSAMASQTVLVIIDGLREDSSREMVILDRLREYGADITLVAPQPSLSYPDWTTILSGQPPFASGVVTNWHDGRAGVQTIFDTAKRAGIKTVFVGPDDFEKLYQVRSKTVATYMRKWDERYMSGEYVDAALRLSAQYRPELLVVHLPDVDEAGHKYGGASDEYANTVAKVDADLRALVGGLLDDRTAFIVVADHGHIDAGGHGGWEPEVVTVPAVIVGPDIVLGKARGRQEDVASTVALLAGIAPPNGTAGRPLAPVAAGASGQALEAARKARYAFVAKFVQVVSSKTDVAADYTEYDATQQQMDTAERFYSEQRLKADRRRRLDLALGGLGIALFVIGLIGLVSRPAFWSALTGMLAYYVVYNGLFFLVHEYRWSLSAFNSEDMIQSWMNMRLVEAAAAMLVGAAVAALVYPLLRPRAKGAAGEFLPGWLTLGPATALFVLATLGAQVAWFYWAWGIKPEWRLPDLLWGFKYDLDLIQATAIGFVALVTPLVTFAIGRYHPRVRRVPGHDEGGPTAGAPQPVRPLVPSGTGSAAEER